MLIDRRGGPVVYRADDVGGDIERRGLPADPQAGKEAMASFTGHVAPTTSPMTTPGSAR